ncbi:MAG: SCO family protein [Chitinophagaceae bacterium]|nr:SCO family protein [Chitinophagaceae bacterium]
MRKKIWWYVGFFILLLVSFYLLIFKDTDFSKSNLPVINADVQGFSFINQNGKTITENTVENKVYVAEYFFTTCKGICPKMNANMRRVYDVFKEEPDFLILSHTCMPETDSVSLLKEYEKKMLTGRLVKIGGSYQVEADTIIKNYTSTDKWNFLTGDKNALYKMARESYLIDNDKTDSLQNISDQFIHTQFFALVDKQRRVRGIYDGLKEDEIQKLMVDIKDLLKEKRVNSRFMNGFSNTPN